MLRRIIKARALTSKQLASERNARASAFARKCSNYQQVRHLSHNLSIQTLARISK
jgi:hypothetical protein